MNRRAFVAGLGAVLAAPLAVGAQQIGKIYRVAFLTAYSSETDFPLFDSFRQGMWELGYEEGRNVAYETRWAEGKLDRLPALAAQLITLKPDVMVASSTPAVLAAKRATTYHPDRDDKRR